MRSNGTFLGDQKWVFQEVEKTIMRLKVVVFMRSKASIIFDNFDQEVIIIDFESHDQSWVFKNVHEIKSI